MRAQKYIPCFLVVVLLAGVFFSVLNIQPGQAKNPDAPLKGATAYELIAAMNTLRMANGLPALIEDPIIDAVAQNTADIMAANQMSWHIGDVRGRIKAAGYGGGGTVFATENFAVGTLDIDEIMVMWSDPDHMRPAAVAAYCNVGAGVAQAANGSTYYILQAAYVSEHACGEYNFTPEPGATYQPGVPSQFIIPVKLATPDAEGKVYHTVLAGQSLWSIAIAYQITIHDLEVWNNISRNTPLLTGQRLFIPGKNTVGYATPTPVGMIIPSTPGVDGKIIHVVQPYNALITIAEAYKVTVERILLLNAWQEDWPLQIGQKLIIYPGNITPSPTPRPLTPVEKLTPASDGNYYHVVHTGETLSWIAGLYNVALSDLMAWNGLSANSIIRPDQQLLLQVTPPATETATPAPPTATEMPTVTRSPLPPTHLPTLTATAAAATAVADAGSPAYKMGWDLLIVGVVASAGGMALLVYYRRKQNGASE
jgi:LysM repeat protein